MSEIIFPSEIITPAEWDTENSIANNLVANGVGIFLTTDNLTTVLDVVTGDVGTSADITNNELGEVSNGYRMGVDITGLTVDEQSSITANPYQLFKTAETVENEYGLTMSAVGESISIPFTGAYDVDVIDSFDAVVNYIGTDTFTLNGATPVQIKKITGTHDNGYEILDFNQTVGENVQSHTSGMLCELIGFPATSGSVRSYGEIVGYNFGTFSDIRAIFTTNLFSFLDGSDYIVEAVIGKGLTGNFWILGSSSNWNNVFIIVGGTVKQRYGSVYLDHGVIFPTDGLLHTVRFVRTGSDHSVYVDGILKSQIISSLDSLGVHSQIGYSLSGTATGICAKVYVKNLTTSEEVNYDFTTGDVEMMVDGVLKPAIEETINGNHAEIVGGSTSKWQKVVPVHKFTTNDYATLALLNSDQNADTENAKEFLLKSDITGSTLTGFPAGLTLKGEAAITTPLTLITTGRTKLDSLTLDDIDATSANDVELYNVGAANVTG